MSHLLPSMHICNCLLQSPDLSHLLDSGEDSEGLYPKAQLNSANVSTMYPPLFRDVDEVKLPFSMLLRGEQNTTKLYLMILYL